MVIPLDAMYSQESEPFVFLLASSRTPEIL